jgi:hypothetical protein
VLPGEEVGADVAPEAILTPEEDVANAIIQPQPVGGPPQEEQDSKKKGDPFKK